MAAPLGGWLLQGAVTLGPRNHLLVAGPSGPPILVLTRVRLRGSACVLHMRNRHGSLVAQGSLTASDKPQWAALVAPSGGVVQVATEPEEARLTWLQADAFSLAGGVRLTRLMPHAELAADAAWPRHYGIVPAIDLQGQLREAAYRALRAPCQVDWIEGLKLEIEPANELYRAIVLSGLYEPDLMLALARHLPQGGTFVDGGANVGIFTLFAANRVGPAGRVFAFEPSAREFAQLQRNIAINGLDQVSAHRVALSDAPGRLDLRIADERHGGHNTIGRRFAGPETGLLKTEGVPAMRLDDLLADEPRVDAIKLDIEGAELRALQGATETLRRCRPALAIEMNGPSLESCGSSAAEVMAFLAAHDYTAHDIDPASGALLAGCATEPSASKNIMALPK